MDVNDDVATRETFESKGPRGCYYTRAASEFMITPMSTNTAPNYESTGVEHTLAYTRHIEPPEQGGAEYVRCTGCGHELLVELGGRRRLPHADGCANASR